MYPMKLIPETKDYIWGGKKLKTEYNISGDSENIAEAWVLSVHNDGKSVVANGEFQGKTLKEILEKNKSFIGENLSEMSVMIKLIDAQKNLSIQVHPDDEYAKKIEGDNGKTEAWYILDCEPDAEIIFGFEKPLTKEEFVCAIKEEKLDKFYKKVKVKKGDCFLIEAGTLHAICKGIVIAEVQQSSNVTYRVYDYGRTDAKGNKRELHIEKAIDVTKLQPAENKAENSSAKCEYFDSRLFEIQDEYFFEVNKKSFAVILCTDGKGVLNYDGGKIEISKGECVFIPAGTGKLNLNGSLTVLETRV